jgi:hypothetical protein
LYRRASESMRKELFATGPLTHWKEMGTCWGIGSRHHAAKYFTIFAKTRQLAYEVVDAVNFLRNLKRNLLELNPNIFKSINKNPEDCRSEGEVIIGIIKDYIAAKKALQHIKQEHPGTIPGAIAFDTLSRMNLDL